ncbi:MAG: tetratricopeptide repeat protein [Planctomycetaceae bacterium]
MQPTRRHELETNGLADSMAALVERVRPHLNAIGLVAALAVIALAGWSLVQSRRSAAREESWDACSAAFSPWQPNVLQDVTERYAGTPAAQWALLILADADLDTGSRTLVADRQQAEQRLRAAEARYSAVLASAPLEVVGARATFGLAKARESLGTFDEARRGYEAIVREHPSSPMRPLAEERIAALGRESTRQWYDWLASQKPAAPANAADGAVPTRESPAPGPGADGPPPAPAGTGTGAAG